MRRRNLLSLLFLSAVLMGCPSRRSRSGTQTDPIRYTLIARSSQDSMSAIAAKAAEVAASRAASGGGLYFRIERESPEEPTAKAQAAVIDRIVASKPDGILLALAPSEEVDRAIRSAKGKGVPLVCLWQDSPKSGRLVACGPNDAAMGEELARQLLDVRNGMSGGKVAILSSTAKADSLEARVKGFRRHMKIAAPATKVLSPLYCDSDPVKAAALVREALRKYPDIKALICLGDWLLTREDGLAGLPPPPKLTVLVGDVSTETRAALRVGKVARVVAPRCLDVGTAGINALETVRRDVKDEFVTPIDTGFDVLYFDDHTLPIGDLRSGLRVFTIGQYDINWSEWLDKGAYES